VFLPALKEEARSQRGKIPFEKTGSPLGDSETGKVTAILTAYKRSKYLAMQIEALRRQSVPPDEIWLWCNDNESVTEDFSGLVDRVVISNSNWKFWGRFALANMARTPFVALFDDDILPQPEWIKHCLNTLESGTDGILGGSGVILPREGGYSSKHKVGWNGHHYDTVKEVDLVGHAWFISKAHLKYMWYEQPYSWENGEDIHLSYSALKHGGIKTYVPSHPEENQELWSSRPDFGKKVSRTAATHKTENHHSIRGAMVDAYRADGWEITCERTNNNKGVD